MLESMEMDERSIDAIVKASLQIDATSALNDLKKEHIEDAYGDPAEYDE